MAAIPLTQGGPVESDHFEHGWSGSHIQVHLLSDIGKRRKRNEDYCTLCVPENKSLEANWGLLFAVADGMGGASAGERASRLALETTIEEYYSGLSDTIPARLRDALSAANRAVFVESENDPSFHGMGTTVSLVIIHGDCAYVAQVGDSRVYLWREGQHLFQVTDDHSLVAEQVRNGIMTPEEARTHSLRNLITRAVGIRNTVKTDLFAFHIKEGDTLLICSDGLTGLVEDAEIAEMLTTDGLQGTARKLIGCALDKGGVDNITVALIRVTEPSVHHDLQPGASEVSSLSSRFLRTVKTFLRRRNQKSKIGLPRP